jgi:two-component system, chemotaxis family, chemotaxis protein CheY
MTRILVVEDQASIRQMTCSALRHAGFDKLTAAIDGEEAWEMLKQATFDLVLTDLEMPRLDGLGLLRRIRSDPVLGTLPTILLTSRRSAAVVTEAASLRANSFLIKPATTDSIARHIRFAIQGLTAESGT